MTVAMLARPSLAPGTGSSGGKVLSIIDRTRPIETRSARLVTRRVPVNFYSVTLSTLPPPPRFPVTLITTLLGRHTMLLPGESIQPTPTQILSRQSLLTILTRPSATLNVLGPWTPLTVKSRLA